MNDGREECQEQTVFWPGHEDLEARCVRDKGHEGQHWDEIFGGWDE